MPKRFTVQDSFFKKAQEQGYRARSAFKLIGVLERFPRFLPRNASVLDLGCCPGSFLQVLKKHSPKKITGIDIQTTKAVKGTEILRGDVFTKEVREDLRKRAPFRVITSDMAPKTTGIADTDQFRSVELCEQVLDICDDVLASGGNLLVKIFVGADFDEFWKEFQSRFAKTHTYKPPACRDRSRETFLVGMGFLGKKEQM